MSDDLEVVWTGATHRQFPVPIGRLTGNGLPASGSAQTRGRILAAVNTQWRSVRAIADHAKFCRETAQVYLDGLVRDGEVEKLKVGGNGHGYQMLYRRGQ